MIMTNTLAYYDKDMNQFTFYFSMNKIWLKHGEFVWQIPVLLRNRFERDGKRDLSFFSVPQIYLWFTFQWRVCLLNASRRDRDIEQEKGRFLVRIQCLRLQLRRIWNQNYCFGQSPFLFSKLTLMILHCNISNHVTNHSKWYKCLL
jgi:hypothetical protein